MLGLKHNTNVLVEHDPAWASEYAKEQASLAAALGHFARGMEHYGSTAVSGLIAKPILDILVGVSPLDDWRHCHDPLLSLGYDYAAHAGVAGHHIFGRGRDRSERTHLVHVVLFDGPSWTPNLRFRDALRNDPELRAAYAEIKLRAANAAPDSRPRYNQLKQSFIDTIKAGLA